MDFNFGGPPMNSNSKEFLKRDPVELAQELLQNVNSVWREVTLKSKPRVEFVNTELSKLKSVVNELCEHFLKGNVREKK